MTASRWRFWDVEFHDSILDPATKDELLSIRQIKPVGTLTHNLNIPSHILRLHTFEEIKSGTGRGRGRKVYHDAKRPIPNSSESLKDFAAKRENAKILNEKEWPSLGENFEQAHKICSDRVEKERNLFLSDYEQPIMSNLGYNNQVTVDNSNTSACDGTTTSDDSYHVHVNNYTKEKDFLKLEYLKSLNEPEKYVLIKNLPLRFDDLEFQETILSFGAIDSFKLQVSENESSMVALVKMENPSHCAWVVSCLDGSSELCENHRLHVESVSELLGLNEQLNFSM